MNRVSRTKRFLSFFLLVVFVLLASSTTKVFAETEEAVEEIDSAAEASARSEAEEAAANKAREEESSRKARESEAKRIEEEAALAEAAAKIEEEQLAAALAAEKANAIKAAEEAATKATEKAASVKKMNGSLKSLATKISGVTDLVVEKTQSLIEQAKSMTGKQKKQAVAFVAAAGFGTAFIASAAGRAAPTPAVKSRAR